MGAAQGLLGFAGLSFLPATGVFFLVAWGDDVLLYHALGIARMPWSWSGAELAADLWGKGVRAAAGLAVSATVADHRAARYAERLRATLEADPARLADALSGLPAHLVKTDARDGREIIFGEFTGVLRREPNQRDSGLRVEDMDGCVLLPLEDE